MMREFIRHQEADPLTIWCDSVSYWFRCALDALDRNSVYDPKTRSYAESYVLAKSMVVYTVTGDFSDVAN